jgi:hypothetical protein
MRLAAVAPSHRSRRPVTVRRRSAAALEQELLQIEMRKREVEAQLHTANFAHKRFADFLPIRGTNLITGRLPTSTQSLSAAAAQKSSGAAPATSNFPTFLTHGHELMREAQCGFREELSTERYVNPHGGCYWIPTVSPLLAAAMDMASDSALHPICGSACAS